MEDLPALDPVHKEGIPVNGSFWTAVGYGSWEGRRVLRSVSPLPITMTYDLFLFLYSGILWYFLITESARKAHPSSSSLKDTVAEQTLVETVHGRDIGDIAPVMGVHALMPTLPIYLMNT